jgi:electron transport complex protein RnfG
MPAVILCVICLITTGLLSLTYELTREERDRQAEAAANANRLALYPQAATFEAIDTPLPEGLLEATEAKAADGSLIGYLFLGTKRGYGGQVPVMVAIDSGGTIIGVRVLSNDETPGLGKKVEQDTFLRQFVNQAADKQFALKVENSKQLPIDAVSGATISSRAVTESVNIALRFFQDLDKEDQ